MTTSTESPILEVKGLQMNYGAVQAVKTVDLLIPHGEITVLLGANGAGKSSVLNACMGLVPASAASITFKNENILGKSTESIVHRGMTLSPEGRLVFPKLTVLENLVMGAAGTSRLRAAAPANIEQKFDLFPRLRERSSQLAGSLSGGEQQMLAIARALMSDPTLLLLDEPSLGLAPNIVDQIFDLIVALHRMGTTILLVEQNAEVSMQIAHHAFIMKSGRVIASGRASELRQNVDLHKAYMGV